MNRTKNLQVARKMGEQCAMFALDAAEQQCTDFGSRAYAFIVSHVRANGPIPGEMVTLAAREAGIAPRDDRSFGAIYAKAIREGAIKVVGHARRVRGHGTSGGSVYAAGVSA